MIDDRQLKYMFYYAHLLLTWETPWFSIRQTLQLASNQEKYVISISCLILKPYKEYWENENVWNITTFYGNP